MMMMMTTMMMMTMMTMMMIMMTMMMMMEVCLDRANARKEPCAREVHRGTGVDSGSLRVVTNGEEDAAAQEARLRLGLQAHHG